MRTRHLGGSPDVVLSDAAMDALSDLKALGYDLDALMKRGMDSDQVLELRDKAYRYRGIKVPTTVSRDRMDDVINLFNLGVNLGVKTSDPEQAKALVRQIFYLAERQLADI